MITRSKSFWNLLLMKTILMKVCLREHQNLIREKENRWLKLKIISHLLFWNDIYHKHLSQNRNRSMNVRVVRKFPKKRVFTFKIHYVRSLVPDYCGRNIVWFFQKRRWAENTFFARQSAKLLLKIRINDAFPFCISFWLISDVFQIARAQWHSRDRFCIQPRFTINNRFHWKRRPECINHCEIDKTHRKAVNYQHGDYLAEFWVSSQNDYLTMFVFFLHYNEKVRVDDLMLLQCDLIWCQMSLGRANRIVISSLFFLEKNQSNVIQSDSRWAQADIERPTNVHDFINFIIFRIKLCIFHFSVFFRSSQFHSVISLFLFIFHNSNKINTTHFFVRVFLCVSRVCGCCLLFP